MSLPVKNARASHALAVGGAWHGNVDVSVGVEAAI
jgi:hypothetical protein